MLLKLTYLQCLASLVAAGVVCGYRSLVTTLIAVACSQFDKLKVTNELLPLYLCRVNSLQ